MRTSEQMRSTKETRVTVRLALDGGDVAIDTGIGFFDHMLQAFAVHGGFGLEVAVKGDLEVDCHHTIEDTGIVLGRAFCEALGDKSGIARYGSFLIPMDETLASAAVDVSGRPFLVFNATFPEERVGGFDTCMCGEFFRAFAMNAGITLHLNVPYGGNSHHQIEALFKAAAHALSQAVAEIGKGTLSTKGTLEYTDAGRQMSDFRKRSFVMLIFPAIDIKNGACVRLYQGELATAEQVADSALEAAKGFRAAGADWVHMVDLDGAVEGARKNTGVFLEVARESGLKVEVGGGIRTIADIDFYLENGISRVILGSVALRDAALVRQAVAAYGEKIAVGIDARDGMVAAEGWVETSTVSDVELARRMEQAGVRCLICTDIARDGMLSGPNIVQLARIQQAVGCDLVASGGVTDLSDIIALRDCGLYGAICGRSIYKGTLDLRQAIQIADDRQ